MNDEENVMALYRLKWICSSRPYIDLFSQKGHVLLLQLYNNLLYNFLKENPVSHLVYCIPNILHIVK